MIPLVTRRRRVASASTSPARLSPPYQVVLRGRRRDVRRGPHARHVRHVQERRTHVLVENQPLVAQAIVLSSSTFSRSARARSALAACSWRASRSRARRFDAGSLSAVGTMT